MALQAQFTLRPNDNSLYFMIGGIRENFEGSPWPFINCLHRVLLPIFFLNLRFGTADVNCTSHSIIQDGLTSSKAFCLTRVDKQSIIKNNMADRNLNKYFPIPEHK
jgi:hypothetical protein